MIFRIRDSRHLLLSCLFSMFFVSSYAQNSTNNWIWGSNQYGQLGISTFTTKSVPQNVSTTNNFTVMNGASGHTLGLLLDGTVWTWGENTQGELGNGVFTPNPPGGIADPVQVGGLTGIVSITGGLGHCVVLKNNGTVFTWGRNMEGQLGNGSFTNTYPYGIPYPVQVPGLTNVTAVADEWGHVLALKNDGTVWSWGLNHTGELGNGSFSMISPYSISSPAVVPGLSGVVAIASGGFHSLALKSDGTVWIWGDNEDGQLGNGTYINNNVPTKLTSLSNIVSISGGLYHSAAVKSDGTVWTWGYNEYGQLGNGAFTTSPPYSIPNPAQVSSISNVQSVDCGGFHTLALKKDGSVCSWGIDVEGELGNGSLTPIWPYGSSTPNQISGISNAFNIGCGVFHSMALTNSTPIAIVGSVTLQGWSGASLPLVYVNIDGGPMQGFKLTSSSVNSGTFTLPISSNGLHTVKVKVNGFLTQKLSINVNSASTNINFTGQNGLGLKAGDANNNNLVDDTDLLIVINNFLSLGTPGDINGDGIVDDSDLLYTINNFLAAGDF